MATESITTDAAAIARGNIYLPREICDAYFAGISSVALIVREGAIQIVPLSRDSAGGLLLKQRNARGDRVVHAQEFMREKATLNRSSRAPWRCAGTAIWQPCRSRGIRLFAVPRDP